MKKILIHIIFIFMSEKLLELTGQFSGRKFETFCLSQSY